MDLSPAPSRERPAYWNLVIHSVISFLGQSLMQVVDLLFCRDLGSRVSATVGTATSLVAWFIIVGIGLVSSLEYLIPHALGKSETKRANEYFYAGTVVCTLTAIASGISLMALAYLAEFYGMNPEIMPGVQKFCAIVSISYLPIYLIPLLRVELQARGSPHDTTWAFLYGNLLNILLNWMLVLGHGGFSAHGTEGSAWSNTLSRYAILIYLVYRTFRVRKRYHLSLPLAQVAWLARAKEILKMGLPSSLHMLFEMGAFICVSTLAARLRPAQNAAHAIALSIASFAFMIPAGLSSAAAVTMSRALGEGSPGEASQLGFRTLRVGLAYAVLGSLVFLFARGFLIGAYTSDPETIAMGTQLLLIASIFQFGDSMQVILAGCLRGLGETKIQAVVNGFGHWFVGIPTGIFLGFYLGMGIQGLWIGLCIGLFTVAGLLYFRFHSALQKRTL